jgi:hypothetical protein
MKKLADMSVEELRELLSRLEADLEDVEEERRFVLSQTGVHISASTAGRYQAEADHLRERIEEVRRTLGERQG